jgi:hypothetical protein
VRASRQLQGREPVTNILLELTERSLVVVNKAACCKSISTAEALCSVRMQRMLRSNERTLRSNGAVSREQARVGREPTLAVAQPLTYRVRTGRTISCRATFHTTSVSVPTRKRAQQWR